MKHDEQQLNRFIEGAAGLMEDHGLPRMAGRVIGALMICTPPHLSHDALAEQLRASKGSISMSTQLLIRLNIVERVNLHGERRNFYRLREGLWKDFLTKVFDHVQQERDIVFNGLNVLESEPVEMKRRLIEMLIVSDFVLEEWPGLLARWQERRSQLLDKRLAELA